MTVKLRSKTPVTAGPIAQPDADAVAEQFDRIAEMLAPQFPVVTGMLQDARTDLLAFCAFPVAHWRQIWSTNPLERLNREIKRRTSSSCAEVSCTKSWLVRGSTTTLPRLEIIRCFSSTSSLRTSSAF